MKLRHPRRVTPQHKTSKKPLAQSLLRESSQIQKLKSQQSMGGALKVLHQIDEQHKDMA